MAHLAPPPLPDIAKIVLCGRPDVEGALVDFYERGGATFNYIPARKVCAAFLKGGMKPEVAIANVLRMGSQSGRRQNSEVVRLFCNWAQSLDFSFYAIRREYLRIEKDILVPVPVEGYVVKERSASFLSLQPRKTFNPSESELSFVATCIRQLYGVDDFADLDLIILDFSSPEGSRSRVLRVHGSTNLRLFSEHDLTHLLTEFAMAYSSLVAAGYRKPVRPRRDQVHDVRQDDLFGLEGK